MSKLRPRWLILYTSHNRGRFAVVRLKFDLTKMVFRRLYYLSLGGQNIKLITALEGPSLVEFAVEILEFDLTVNVVPPVVLPIV